MALSKRRRNSSRPSADRNPTLTPKVSQRILEVHKELLGLIEIRDAAGARKLMDDHVKMIRSRRVTEHNKSKLKNINCC